MARSLYLSFVTFPTNLISHYRLPLKAPFLSPRFHLSFLKHLKHVLQINISKMLESAFFQNWGVIIAPGSGSSNTIDWDPQPHPLYSIVQWVYFCLHLLINLHNDHMYCIKMWYRGQIFWIWSSNQTLSKASSFHKLLSYRFRKL